jgi:hypothetical protein
MDTKQVPRDSGERVARGGDQSAPGDVRSRLLEFLHEPSPRSGEADIAAELRKRACPSGE